MAIAASSVSSASASASALWFVQSRAGLASGIDDDAVAVFASAGEAQAFCADPANGGPCGCVLRDQHRQRQGG